MTKLAPKAASPILLTLVVPSIKLEIIYQVEHQIIHSLSSIDQPYMQMNGVQRANSLTFCLSFIVFVFVIFETSLVVELENALCLD